MSMTTTPIEQHRTLVGNAFAQAVEARKRAEYVRDEIRRGDLFGAGEDIALALDALADVCHELAQAVGEPAPAPENESDEGPWLDANGAFGLYVADRDDHPRNHPDDCDCDDCGFENHSAHLSLLGHSTAASRIFDEQ